MIDREALRELCHAMSGREPRLFRAPGRVNLIGEHTDYNGGFVLPMAIERETVVAAAPRGDRLVHVHSLNVDETIEVALDAPPGPVRRGHWIDYVEGMARALEARGIRLTGADCVVESDVPEGSGLSSSAALEISFGLALVSLAGVDVDRVTLALAGQSAEHSYVGTMCGIMDQYVVALARKEHALLIDCSSLESTPIPLDDREYVVAICDSRVKHSLASSEYNTRRAECERGVELLRAVSPDIAQLRDVSEEEIRRNLHLLPYPIDRRCLHVVTEIARTLAAAEALRKGDMEAMGRLMLESHQSLEADYEVSCLELDTLVRIAMSVDGVEGSRMTGGGFGGCTVSLVRHDRVDEFRKTVELEYTRETGLIPLVYVTEAADGASELL